MKKPIIQTIKTMVYKWTFNQLTVIAMLNQSVKVHTIEDVFEVQYNKTCNVVALIYCIEPVIGDNKYKVSVL